MSSTTESASKPTSKATQQPQADAGTKNSTNEDLSPAMVQQRYRELTQECQQLMSKTAELEMDKNEHKLVEDTLKPLDPDRRAFRLVGSVLVERTVKEVLPSVQLNRENLENTIQALRERLTITQRDLAELKAKYNIDVNGR